MKERKKPPPQYALLWQLPVSTKGSRVALLALLWFWCERCCRGASTHGGALPSGRLDKTLTRSSPKKTFVGSQSSSQTLILQSMADILATTSSDNSQPSKSKLASMRDLFTDLGMMLQPFCSPHMSNTCCGVRPLDLATARTSSWSNKMEFVLPKFEYPVEWIALEALYATSLGDGLHGWSSIWLTAGTICCHVRVAVMGRANVPCRKGHSGGAPSAECQSWPRLCSALCPFPRATASRAMYRHSPSPPYACYRRRGPYCMASA